MNYKCIYSLDQKLGLFNSHGLLLLFLRGLVPHCLEILRTCHNLTEKLVGLAMGNSHQLRSHEKITDLVTVAKRISPRVDEVVRSMYPPLDPRLLEARFVLGCDIMGSFVLEKSCAHQCNKIYVIRWYGYKWVECFYWHYVVPLQ